MFSLNKQQVYLAKFDLYEKIDLADQNVVEAVSIFNKWSKRFHDRRSADYHILHSIYNYTISVTQKEKAKECLSAAHLLASEGVKVISSVRDAVGEVVDGIEAILATMNQAEDEQKKAWHPIRQAARNAHERWNLCVLALERLVRAIAGVVEKWELYDPGDRYQKEWATVDENKSAQAIRKMKGLECEENAGIMYDDGPIVFAVYYWIGMKVELLYLENGCSSEKLMIPDPPSSESAICPVGRMNRKRVADSVKVTLYHAYEALIHAMVFSLDMYRWRRKWPEIYYCSRKIRSPARYLTLGDLMQTKQVCFNWIKSLSAMRRTAQQVVEVIDILSATVDQVDVRDRLNEARAFAYDLCSSGQDQLERNAANLAEALLAAECKRISVVSAVGGAEMPTRYTSLNSVAEACADGVPLLQQSELTDESSSAKQNPFAKEEIKDLQTAEEIIQPLLKAFPDHEYNSNPLQDYRKLIWYLARMIAVLLNLDEKVPESVPEEAPEHVRRKVPGSVPEKVPKRIFSTTLVKMTLVGFGVLLGLLLDWRRI
jgi:hypothetical protein